MTDKEKLVELIPKCFQKCLRTRCTECEHFDKSPETGGNRFCQAYLFADHLIANGVTVLPETGIGDMSDGYHTFNELYHHRAVLFSVICNLHPLCSWKAKKHHDGTMYDGMFIVGINTPEGQATYHYDIDPYWDMFKVPEAEFAPEWDGHTADEAIRRIALLGTVGTDNNVPTKWISVKNRLPEEFVSVLINVPDEAPLTTVSEGFLEPGGTWYKRGYRLLPTEVTHWQPMPEPPKGD